MKKAGDRDQLIEKGASRTEVFLLLLHAKKVRETTFAKELAKNWNMAAASLSWIYAPERMCSPSLAGLHALGHRRHVELELILA